MRNTVLSILLLSAAGAMAGPISAQVTPADSAAVLLEAARTYRERFTGDRRDNFRFHHVSTDEVFGSLGPDDPGFSETFLDLGRGLAVTCAQANHPPGRRLKMLQAFQQSGADLLLERGEVCVLVRQAGVWVNNRVHFVQEHR